jgi:hypothetical protein
MRSSPAGTRPTEGTRPVPCAPATGTAPPPVHPRHPTLHT